MVNKLHELYEETFLNLKKYISDNSIYEPECKKVKPNEIAKFPLVTCVEGEYEYSYTTLRHTDEIYIFNLMEINIFAQNKEIDGNLVSGVTIKDEIRSHIEKYFQNELRLKVKTVPNAPNVDETVYRCIIYVSCKVDTKFKDKLVLYPY